MRFTQEICQKLFPNTELRVGLSPALTIAKGLAHIGRVDLKVQAFKQEVDDFLTSQLFEKLVKSELPKLSESITPAFYKTIIEVISDKMKEWKDGDLDTLSKVEEEIQADVAAKLSTEAEKLLLSEVPSWLEKLNPKLETLTAEMCAKYGIPMNGLIFDLRFSQLQVQVNELVPEESTNLVAMSLTQEIGGFISKSLLLALNGMGLISFPLLIIGVFVTAAATIIGGEALKEKAKEIYVPLIMRGLIYKREKLDIMLKTKKRKFEEQIGKDLLKELQNQKIFEQILHTIQEHLERQADRYSLFIRQQD